MILLFYFDAKMSIKHTILGFLSWTPLTGYDLKKRFSDSVTMHWSGNNNQIYRTLLELHDEGLVMLEVQQQENKPPRKIYSLTDAGRAELHRWLVSTPKLPQIRETFVLQLAWADELDDAELDDLLERYAAEIRAHLQMLREYARRKTGMPQRTARESYLWDAILKRRITFYERELEWLDELREACPRKESRS